MSMEPKEALDITLDLDLEGATTLRQIFKRLASKVFEEDEGFSGKRPFGDSSWQYEIAFACVRAGILDPDPDDPDDYPPNFDDFIQQCIAAM